MSGWFVTIPLAAFFVFVLHINLQGLVAAVTIGYSVSSTALLYLLIRSNWTKRIEKVKRATVKEYEESPVEVLVVDNSSDKSRGSGQHGDRVLVDSAEKFELSSTGEIT